MDFPQPESWPSRDPVLSLLYSAGQEAAVFSQRCFLFFWIVRNSPGAASCFFGDCVTLVMQVTETSLNIGGY
jgi:hypothetical protein